jgi:hypothetical protein
VLTTFSDALESDRGRIGFPLSCPVLVIVHDGIKGAVLTTA